MSGLLEINALCSGYKQSQVIHDLELKIQPKEIVAIMGRNGMGKTCLLYTSPSPRDKRQSRMPSSA